MLRNVLTVFLILMLILVTGFGYLLWYGEYSDEARLGYKNYENLRKVEIGMDSIQVLEIMDKPQHRDVFRGKIIYYYTFPFGYSESCQVILNMDGKVIRTSKAPDF